MTAAATTVERHVVMTDDAVPLILARFARPGARFVCLLVCDPAADRALWMRGMPSAVHHLLALDGEVCVAELRGCGLSAAAGAAPARSLGDHAILDVPALVRAVSRLSGRLPIHWIGHRRAAAVALPAEGVESVVGVDAVASPGLDCGAGARHVLLLHGADDLRAREDAQRLVAMLGPRRRTRQAVTTMDAHAELVVGGPQAAALWSSVAGWLDRMPVAASTASAATA